MKQMSNQGNEGERQVLGAVITSPAEGPEKLKSLVRVSYVIDIIFLAVGFSAASIPAQLVLQNISFIAVSLLLIAIALRLLFSFASSEAIALRAIHWNPKLLRIMAILLCLLVVGAYVTFGDTNLSLVQVVVGVIISFKLTDLFIQLLPGSRALPVAQLNSAGKILVLLEFLPILLGRASVAPILLHGDGSGEGLLTVIVALLVGLGFLMPETYSFLGKCSKCHRQDHRLIIHAFGSCCTCKRLSLANNRT